MYLKSVTCKFATVLMVFSVAVTYFQQQTPEKKPVPAPTPKVEDQESIKIFTEEVLLPIVAYDAYGRFDPTVSPDDVLVLEDGISQQVKSAHRIPLNVVLLIDMGSGLAFTQYLDVTRSIATRVLSKLRLGDQVSLIQFTDRAEVLQDWTDDTATIAKALDPERGKLLSGNRSRLSQGLKVTTDKLTGREAGSTHVVLITNGDDAPGSEFPAAVKSLLRLQPTLHILSYTTMASQEIGKRKRGLFFDREMKQFYKEYDNATKAGERTLTILAENLSGRIFLPKSKEEALQQGEALAGEIGATCVLTYSPKRPFHSRDDTTPRRIAVFPRRTGLQVRALRTTAATAFTMP